MKILSVSIHNIASIEGPYMIDLEAEPLRNTGIFAIVGQTGSGKSTILDAICLALYNTTPRLKNGNSKVVVDSGIDELATNNVRNLLRKGAVSGYVKVNFLGVDGIRYQSHWAIKRASNKVNGKIQEEQILLKDLDNERILPEHKKTQVLLKIRNLVGLSFEEFTKTVILSQGDFASFLKQKDEERSDILEKLTGTEIYTQISKIVFQKNKQHKEEIELLEKQIITVALLSEEQKNQYTETINILTQEEQTLSMALEQSKKKLQWFTDLKNIQLQVDATQKKLQEALEKQSANQKEYKRLELLENFQNIKPYFEQNISIDSKLQQLKLLKERIATKEQKFRKAENDLTLAITKENDVLNQVKKDFESQAELLTQVKRLDLQIVEQQKFIQKRTDDYKQKDQDFKNIQSEIQICKDRISKGVEYLQPLKDWKNNNNDARIASENKMWLEQITTTLLEVVKDKKSVELQIDTLKKQQLDATKDLTNQTEELEQKQLALSEKQKQLQEIDQQYNQIDVVCINEQNTALNLKLERYNLQKKLVDEIKKLEEQLLNITLKSNQLKEKTEKNDLQLRETRTIKEQKTIELQTVERIFLKLQLSESEQVKLLRSHLHTNEECPVCGATEHPYKQQERDVQMVSTMQQERDSLQILLDKLKEQIIQLQSETDFHQKEIAKLEIDKQELTDILKQKNLLLSEDFKLGSLIEISKQIKQLLHQTLEQISHNTKALQHFTQIRNQKNDLEKLVQQLIKSVEELKNKLHQSQDQKTILENHLKAANIKLDNLCQIENENQKSVLKLHFSDVLYDTLKSDIQYFRNEILEKATHWQKIVNEIEKAEKKIQEIQTEVTTLITKGKTIEEDLQKYKVLLTQESNEIQELQKERTRLFQDKNPIETEQKHQEFVDKKNQEISLLVENLTKLKLDLQSVENQKQSTEQQIVESTTLRHQLSLQIDRWIAQQNEQENIIQKAQLNEWLHFSTDWITSQKKYFQDLKDDIFKQKTILTEKQILLENHKKVMQVDGTEQEIETQVSTLNINFTEVKKELSRLQNIILLDQEKQKAVGELQSQVSIKKERAQQWFVLNDLIGSEKGYKFRKYAQQYTLDRLLQYANYHLRYINRRYTLARIPESLNLQVFDNDMGGEVRSVYSLSGGETFLVSLALALALSSISSSRMNVETLFIDEGFGSLDADTLTIALDALENLQNQGKKIGVISHVQEMAERIPVKIYVNKEGNGKSNISIV